MTFEIATERFMMHYNVKCRVHNSVIIYQTAILSDEKDRYLRIEEILYFRRGFNLNRL